MERQLGYDKNLTNFEVACMALHLQDQTREGFSRSEQGFSHNPNFRTTNAVVGVNGGLAREVGGPISDLSSKLGLSIGVDVVLDLNKWRTRPGHREYVDSSRLVNELPEIVGNYGSRAIEVLIGKGERPVVPTKYISNLIH